MDVDSTRAYCLSFPNAKETLQWGETLCFKIGNKIFALLSLDMSSGTRFCCKCSPERFSELLEVEGCHPAPYVGRYKWIGIERLDCLPDRDFRELIDQSYALIAANLPKKAKLKKSAKRSRR
jgi:predicted DNA-binding protein (MmcQ/YjbR family)